MIRHVPQFFTMRCTTNAPVQKWAIASYGKGKIYQHGLSVRQVPIQSSRFERMGGRPPHEFDAGI